MIGRHWRRAALVTTSLALAVAMLGEAQAAPARITMWDIPESEPYTEWWKEHVAAFNEAHPDIEVTLEVFETEAYRPKIASALAAGTTADIFYLPAGPQGFQALRDGQAKALDGILDAGKLTPAAVAACSTEGKLACLPLYVAPNLMFYNRTHFAEAGVKPDTWANPAQPTWAEFTAAANALKTAGYVPLALGNADSWPGTMYLWSFQNRYGGVQELEAAATGKVDYAAAPSLQKGAKAIADLGQSGWLPLGYNGIAGGQKYTIFTSGQASIIYQGPWLLGRIATDAPEGFDYGFFQFPSIPDGDPNSQGDVVGGFDALYVSAKTAHSEAVATFLNSFTEPAVATSFMDETQNVSVVKLALEAARGSDAMIAKLAATAVQASRISPWWDNYLPPAEFEESTRLIQGLFDGSVTPPDYLAGMDRVGQR